MSTVGVFMPLPPKGPVQPPAESILGQAAQKLAGEGIRVVFGSQLSDGVLTGFTARTLSWAPAETPVKAVYDMWPSYVNEAAWKLGTTGLGEVKLGNPVGFTMMCGDRLQLQRMLEMSGVRMTPVEPKAERFDRALDGWGAGYLKPRFRGMGRRVQHVVKDQDFDRGGEGANQMILQESRGAPAGWDGMVVRLLAQRDVGGGWVFPPSVALRSRGDQVAGSAQDVVADLAAQAVPSGTQVKLRKISDLAVDFLGDDDDIVEMGLDFAIDRFYEPWLIDVESKPKIGLVRLARRQPGRFEAELVELHARPMRYLAMRGKG